MKRWLIFLGGLVLISTFFFHILKPDPFKQLTETLSTAKRAIEQEDLETLMALVSIHYNDSYGIGYPGVKQLFEDIFLRMSDVYIEYDIENIDLNKNNATVLLNVAATASVNDQSSYIVGSHHDRESVQVVLIKQHLKWYIVSTVWHTPSLQDRIPQEYDHYYRPLIESESIEI